MCLAELILAVESENLEFTTEPEADAMYCLETLSERPLKEVIVAAAQSI
ncbi:2380_t:CDS:2 [Ambispora leptoticha]|uniref:2380_t:CDS:1 n=1 Tax=Ambispora leptoticha TaxID=144679 RepID=A0A9N9CYF5_9GLOM|nr:2380_t:CDS:2 [Ambispora leptoticha]